MEVKQRKQQARALKRMNGMLTPMSKYYASEMCLRVTNMAIQVLGGSGYMKDYPTERYVRDARITTIYEGTSQLQVVAAVRGVCSGAFERYVGELEEKSYKDPLLADLKLKLISGKDTVLKAVTYVKGRGTDYMDLSGRRLVDSAIAIIVGHLLLGQAAANERKQHVARRFISMAMPRVRLDCEYVCAGDMAPLEDYKLLAGPVPVAE
ncbi:MAG: hypothetical protein KKB50_14155 [Planctomycetes bacterium]|nr:hypothetical protein [Planctomycetota bacterium]